MSNVIAAILFFTFLPIAAVQWAFQRAAGQSLMDWVCEGMPKCEH